MKFLLRRVSVTIMFFKSVALYLFYWFYNKKNWKTIRMYLQMAQNLSTFAKREKVAKNVGWLAEKFDDITKNYSDEDTKKAANEISGSSGILDDLKIAYSVQTDDKGIETRKVVGNVGPLEAIYDPSNGDVRFGLKL